MARFRGTIHGQRGEAARLGSARSGIHAEVNGWDVGVSVRGHEDHGEPSADQFDIFATGGSNRRHSAALIGTVRLVNGTPQFFPASQPVGDTMAEQIARFGHGEVRQ